ncbi:hemolysin XhlA family protein [Paenibacillus alvei]|uniref:hemolysin XhlA family protein n=1 Tax=Paenibacillus alvei TaxID=44250 RepID=UPI00227FC42E|nr:hemolysin XhlA family protein [Paenibacillus alvei]MCY7484444.1 hemolysin XhlA family protein [Paenibacillus alvei]
MDEQTRMLTDIRERMVRVETKLDSVTDVRDTAEDAKKVAYQAMESTKSAHHRLDKIEKTIFWLGTTVIGAVVLAVIKFTMEGRS